MAQGDGGKQRTCPPAQAQGRRDVGGNGIGPAQQQVAACHHGHKRHTRIKYDEERIFTDLFVYH